MSDWAESYESYNGMTIAELKELLKARDLPVSGKKKDLIQGLIFDVYPSVFNIYLDTSIPLIGTGHWLEQKWKSNRNSRLYFYAAMNCRTLKI